MNLKSNKVDEEVTEKSLTIHLIKRLVELVYTNIYRLEVVFDQFIAIITTLLQIQTGSKVKSMIYIKLAIEANQSVILSYFQHKRNSQQLEGLEQEIGFENDRDQIMGSPD